MAKTQRGFEENDNGKPVHFSGKVTRHQRKSEGAGEIAWTRGPDTAWRKFVRNAVG